MFGESDSESPRVPSPWDSLISVPRSPKRSEIPKLVPEADEGNVEYKLQLLSPTPARFTRLVTQLKWRLLEGGGRAYYELGVSDSGMLVGLPRQQLEESLETLDMMASEIGASVAVVKEIEVPPELSGLAESHVERWDASRRSARRKDLLRMMKRGGSPATSVTELETELSNTDVTDIEAATTSSPATSLASLGGEFDLTQPKPSPSQLPFDPALAMFTVDLGENITDYADDEADALDGDDPGDYTVEFSSSLAISSVYKPRPMRKRATYSTLALPTRFEYTKKRLKNGYPPSQSTNSTHHTGDTVALNSDETHPQPRGAIAQLHGGEQDKGREFKISPLLTHALAHCSAESPVSPVDHHASPSCSMGEPNISALKSPLIAIIDLSIDDTSATTHVSKEPRLIVEVLVVWELSLDEAFLDFEGFSLQ